MSASSNDARRHARPEPSAAAQTFLPFAGLPLGTVVGASTLARLLTTSPASSNTSSAANSDDEGGDDDDGTGGGARIKRKVVGLVTHLRRRLAPSPSSTAASTAAVEDDDPGLPPPYTSSRPPSYVASTSKDEARSTRTQMKDRLRQLEDRFKREGGLQGQEATELLELRLRLYVGM